jgi:hypothetical protein
VHAIVVLLLAKMGSNNIAYATLALVAMSADHCISSCYTSQHCVAMCRQTHTASCTAAIAHCVQLVAYIHEATAQLTCGVSTDYASRYITVYNNNSAVHPASAAY